MKATKQYFPVVLLIMLHKVVLTFESVDEILKCDHSSESYRAVLSCSAVYYAVHEVVLAFESVDEILNCDHSDESYRAALSCGTVCLSALVGWKSGDDHNNENHNEQNIIRIRKSQYIQ